MSEDQIQQFLISKGSYLKDHSENGRSAAKIIYDAAQGYPGASDTKNGIAINSSTGTVSPRIILIYLQKEQSLITRTTRNDDALRTAMGYGCPDSGGCNSKYAGFTNQVDAASWQLRYNYERAQGRGFYDYQVGQVLPINDSGGYCGSYCGLYQVTLTKRSTASVYRYTPHVFYSAYNVWKLYNTWFGGQVSNDTYLNDTAKFTLKTYSQTEKVSGAKADNSLAYLGSQLIAGAGTRSWNHTFGNLPFGINNFTIQYKDGSGNPLGSKSIQIVVQKPGDINGDNKVDLQDLSIFASYWNETNPEDPLANLNPSLDHVIDVSDLSILAGYWGK